MIQIIELFKVNLNAVHGKTNTLDVFVFEFKGFKFTFLVKFNYNKIIVYELLIRDYPSDNKEYTHLEKNGKACLGLPYELPTEPWDVIITVADWINNFSDIENKQKYHDHGYRHGAAGVVEHYLQRRFLPFRFESLKELNPDEWDKIMYKLSNKRTKENIIEEMRSYFES